MVLETQDCAYFGFYNMEYIKQMGKLRELDIYAERGPISSWWNEEERHFNLLMRDFEEAIEADPGWECPRVKIFEGETGKEMRYIEGGARIPGWVPDDE